MKKVFAVALAIGIVLATSLAYAQAVRDVGWSDLVPRMEPFDDPFERLTTEQKMDLRLVAAAREVQSKSNSALAPEQSKTYEAALDRLKRDHVDIDGLLARRAEITEKRRKATEGVNESLNGQQVRVPGYVLPLEMDGKKVTEFLLVPYVGACIHAPTPPANQIVHVKVAKGFEVAGLFAPVWVEGRIRTERSEPQLSFIDGSASIRTAYALDAAAIKPYSQ